MKISFKPVRKLLIDRDMAKEDLRDATCLSSAPTAKMGKDGNVTTDTLTRICTELHCGLEQVAEVPVSCPAVSEHDE